ncbi:hypothetical protein ASF08_12850 [Methylobacterium sp. Leaf85]|nr:hypothetical protein ASF08_12850 [Methylobacterium sp. Leaf85]
MQSDVGEFTQFVAEYSEEILSAAYLIPQLSRARLDEVHGAWTKDLERVEENENQLEEGLDHFKRAGHLAFWLRRMGPVVDFIDYSVNIADGIEYNLSEKEADFRDLMFGHANEYIAFDIGLQYCKFYEPQTSLRAQGITLSDDYTRTTCHFLKYKQVSPHSLFMIYKSLFYTGS